MPYFKAADQAEVLAFMQAHPFVTLIGVNDRQQPVATQIPVFTDEKDGEIFITGHIMRQTDHHRALECNPQALVLYTGPHAYVSASWYTQPKGASTWNYASVHAAGTLRWLDDAALEALLIRTTLHFEQHQTSPSLVQDFPHGYLEQHMKAIVAFEIAVSEIKHVFKLSQNRDEASYDNIVRHLQAQGGTAAELATLMQNRKHKVFAS